MHERLARGVEAHFIGLAAYQGRAELVAFGLNVGLTSPRVTESMRARALAALTSAAAPPC
jgi:hypothetical protein